MMTEQELLNFLDAGKINYRRIEHEAVFTVAESSKIDERLGGAGTKNLFLRNKKGTEFFLVVVEQHKRVDMKRLAAVMESDRFSFASAEKMKTLLGVNPGSVTLAAIINDKENQVKLFFDEDIWNAPAVTCHPLVNTATIELSHESLVEFLKINEKTFKVIKIPEQDQPAKNVH